MTKLKDGTVRLSDAEHGALVEALRRRTRFLSNPTGGDGITQQWTGLGYVKDYKAAVASGLMEPESTPHRGCMGWWRLTERGARIIAYWFGQGFNFEKIESGPFPSNLIPAEVL